MMILPGLHINSQRALCTDDLLSIFLSSCHHAQSVQRGNLTTKELNRTTFVIGRLVSMLFGDKMGRRRCILVGCCILIVGAVLQTASYSLAQMIVGRVVAGVRNGMNTVAIPVWQSKTARTNNRGKLIFAQLVTNVLSILITNVCLLTPSQRE